MVLWKKESCSSGAAYVNLIEVEKFERAFTMNKLFIPRKNTVKSADLRSHGNVLVKQKKYREAMEVYNQCLRFAKNESEHLCFGFANRSLCFYYLNNYNRSLRDIELAEKAKYPPELMYKLDKRKAICLEQLKQHGCQDEGGKSFPSNLQSKFISIKDIERSQSFCETCQKENDNFIPCESCSHAIFCDDHCKESNEIHKIICRAVAGEAFLLRKLAETIIIAAIQFGNAEEMMQFVEEALAKSTNGGTNIDRTGFENYLKFLNLKFAEKDYNDQDTKIVNWVYFMLLEIDLIKERFTTHHAKCFLMHLILHHHYILSSHWDKFYVL